MRGKVFPNVNAVYDDGHPLVCCKVQRMESLFRYILLRAPCTIGIRTVFVHRPPSVLAIGQHNRSSSSQWLGEKSLLVVIFTCSSSPAQCVCVCGACERRFYNNVFNDPGQSRRAQGSKKHRQSRMRKGKEYISSRDDRRLKTHSRAHTPHVSCGAF